LLTVTRKAGQSTETIIKGIEEILGDKPSVRQLRYNKLLQINNLDEITNKEDVITAINVALGCQTMNEKLVMRDLHTWKDGTQMALVYLLEPEAIRFLKKGRIKVGWLSCPIKIKDRPVRCFRCHGFDHQIKDCQGIDNSHCCLRCGSNSHYIRECISDRQTCNHCIGLNDNGDTAHFSGSKKCRALRPLQKNDEQQ